MSTQNSQMVNSFRTLKSYFSRYFHQPVSPSVKIQPLPISPPLDTTKEKIRKRDKAKTFFRYYTGRNKEIIPDLPEMLTLDPFAPHNRKLLEEKSILLDSLPRSPKFGSLKIEDFDNKENEENGENSKESFEKNEENKDSFKENFQYQHNHSYDIIQPSDLLPKKNHGKWERSQMLRHTVSKTSLRRKSVVFLDPVDDSQVNLPGNISHLFKSVSTLFNNPKLEITTDVNNEVVLAKFPESPITAQKAFESHTGEIDISRLKVQSVKHKSSLFLASDDLP